MKVTIKFFFDFQEITGRKKVEVEIEKEITIKAFIRLLEEYFPEIKKITKYPEDYSVLLNGEYAKLTTSLKNKDIIDLFSVIDGG